MTHHHKPQGGETAAKRGKLVEQFMATAFHAAGYEPLRGHEVGLLRKHIAQGHDPATFFSEQRPTLDWHYVQRMRLLPNLYGLPWSLDAFLWREYSWNGQGLVVEIKSQQTTGSVDEKLPFVALSLHALNRPAVVLTNGSGFRAAALSWLGGFCQGVGCQVEHFADIASFQRYIGDGRRSAPKLHVVVQQGRLF